MEKVAYPWITYTVSKKTGEIHGPFHRQNIDAEEFIQKSGHLLYLFALHKKTNTWKKVSKQRTDSPEEKAKIDKALESVKAKHMPYYNQKIGKTKAVNFLNAILNDCKEIVLLEKSLKEVQETKDLRIKTLHQKKAEYVNSRRNTYSPHETGLGKKLREFQKAEEEKHNKELIKQKENVKSTSIR